MNIFLGLMIFIMGSFFGSFFTLAIYRIPLKKDITHERSFCPNCNHRLEFLDLIPILSYLFLGGKCRYCKKKIRIRYFLLEILSGIIFVLAYFSLRITNIYIDSEKVILFINFITIYITVSIVAGIDKEYRKINTSVLLFGGICESIYILYLYIIEDTSIYRYSIYFAIFILFWITNIVFQKRKINNYFLQILLLLTYIALILGYRSILLIIVISFVIAFFIYPIKTNIKIWIAKLSMGFLIGIPTIAYIIIQNFIQFY